MPLVRVEVSNEYGLGSPEMYMAANDDEPKEIMEGVAVAGLVGLLRQLGDLAERHTLTHTTVLHAYILGLQEIDVLGLLCCILIIKSFQRNKILNRDSISMCGSFAADVFHGLQEEVTITCSRSYKLMGRIQRIEAAVAPFEKAVLAQRTHLHLAYTAGVTWHAPDRCEKNHFVYSDMPQFILDSYEDCRNPPHFHLLDRFDPGGPGSCLKRYSDPTIFSNASEASGSGDATTQKVATDMKTLRSNVGGHASPFRPISTYYAALRPDLYEQSNSDQRNGSGCSKGDICRSYSMQPKEQESRGFISARQKSRGTDDLDHNFLKEKVTDACDDIQINPTQVQGVCSSYSYTSSEKTCLIYETVDRLDVQTCDQSLQTSGSGVIHLEDFENETDQYFMDAPNTIEPKSRTGIYCMRKQDLDHLEDRAASGRVPAKYEYNSVSSAEKSFMSAQITGNSLNPSSKKNISSSGNGGITDSKNKESISCRVSFNLSENGAGMAIIGDTKEPEKAVAETSDVTNGGLLGLQPSKPPLGSALDDLPQEVIFGDRDPWKPDETNSFQNIQEGGLDMDSPPTCQEYQESDESSREKFWKKIPADAYFKLGRSSNFLHPHYANSTVSAISTSFLSVDSEFQAARNHPEIGESSSRDNQLRDGEEDLSHASNLNANAYEQEKHQNIPGRTEHLSGDGYLMQSPPVADMKISVGPMDGFPTFQLVPEVSITRLNVGSLSDGNHIHQSPRKDRNSKEPEFATAPDDPPLPPVQWWGMKPHRLINTENMSEKSNSEGEANNSFLNQIRTKSLSLRPTVPAKPTVPSGSSTNVQIMTILHKVNAIRQAVGSDDGDNWSDT